MMCIPIQQFLYRNNEFMGNPNENWAITLHEISRSERVSPSAVDLHYILKEYS